MKLSISSLQAVILLYCSVVPTAILTIPSVVMAHSGQDAWVAVIAAGLVGLGVAWLIGVLVTWHPGQSVQTWVRNRYGSFAGKAVCLLLAYYYITVSSIILREFTGILSSQVLSQTPIYVVMVAILLVSGYMVWSGIEVIARTGVFVAVVSMAPYLVSFIFLLGFFHFEYLLPMFRHHPADVAYSGLLPAGWFSEIAVLLIVAPYLREPGRAKKIAVWGLSLSAFHLAVTVLLAIVVLGPDLPKVYEYPSFSLIEVIRVGNAVERIDILFVAFWICTIYVKQSIFLFGAYQCLQDALGLRKSRPVLFVLLLWVMLTSVSAIANETEFDQLNRWGTPYVLIFFNIVLPGLLAIGLLFRKNRQAEGEDASCGTEARGYSD